MKYKMYNIDKLEEEINDNSIYERCRKKEKDFTRNRKLTPKDLIYYLINNRGKTTKMELYDFIEQYDYENVSDVALLKQREKLNEEIFKELNRKSLINFYKLFKDEVKTYKDYILTAIDGSDCEIPNTKATRERYKSISGNNDGKVARIKLSNCYDLLNHYVLDTEIEEYKHSENELANRHMNQIEKIIGDYPIVSIRDRGYLSLSYMFHSVMKNKKFVIRLNQRYFKVFLEYADNSNLTIRPVVLSEINRLLKCKPDELGYSLYKCPNCDNELMVHNTCKCRTCPSCGIKYAKQRTQNIMNHLYNCPHRHITFTIPGTLWNIFRENRKLLNLLFEAVNSTLSCTPFKD